MPTSRRRRRRGTLPPPTLGRPPPKSRFSPFAKLLTTILAIATLVGGVAAVIALLPRLTVEWAGPSSDDRSTWHPSFVIKNTNVVPLEHVKVSIVICKFYPNLSDQEARNQTPDKCNYHELAGELIHPEWKDHRLPVDEPFTVNFTDLMFFQTAGRNEGHGSNGYADIAVRIRYFPWFLHFKSFEQVKTFRFIGRRLVDGQILWNSYPID
jgi:hypothetical protein